MENRAWSHLPPEIQRVLEWYFLLLEAEQARIDSAFHERFATVDSTKVVALVEEYVLERFDVGAGLLAPALASPDTELIKCYEQALEGGVTKLLDYVKAVFQFWPDRAQQQVQFQISRKLRSRQLALISKAKLILFDQQRPAIRRAVDQVVSSSRDQLLAGQRVIHRRRLIDKYRRAHDLSAAAFARRVGISATAIRGIVKDDRKRFSESTRDRLLRAIGVSRELWDGPEL